MIVKTIEDLEDLPKGSCIQVELEDGEDYSGLWSFNCFTISVIVPKSKCEIMEEWIVIIHNPELAKQIIDSCSKPVTQEAKDALQEKIDSVKVLFEEKDSTLENT